MTEDVSRPNRRRWYTAAIASATALVGLATGLLTLRDQIFGGSEDRPVVVDVERQPQQVKEFSGKVGHFVDGQAFVEFLIANNRTTVRLDVAVPVREAPDGSLRQEEPFVKTDCDRGAAPGSEFCSGFRIFIPPGVQSSDTLHGFAHGAYALEGYFRIDVSSRSWMGERPVRLTPATRPERDAAS